MLPNATKIVATLGPASNTLDTLEAMVRAGVRVVRLNFSHGSAEEHQARAAMVRAAAQRAGREVAIMADLQGPKIRVGRFAQGSVQLDTGAAFVLDAERTELGDIHTVGLDYPSLPREVQAGDTLLLNDGLINLHVDHVQGPRIHTTVVQGGVLSNNKGINKLGGGLSAPALTDKDRADLQTAVQLGADYIAISFVQDAQDMEQARALCKAAAAACNGHRPRLIAKIERAEALGQLHGILQASDGIMVARGDLAVEVGHAAVPALQKRMIALARQHDKVVITATQMMESMIHSPQPTRAEVSDVANAVLDGTDAVMLSAETAVGQFPVETVQHMADICRAAEEHMPYEIDGDFAGQTFRRVDQSIAMGALFTATHLHAKAIVTLTESGSTALWLSRHNLQQPIYALTSQVRTQRRMALYRNVHTLLIDTHSERDAVLHAAETTLKAHSLLETGDVYVITCGEPMGQPGGTNMLKVCKTH